MNRYSRYVLIIFVAITILLLGFAIYVTAIFDPNAYKSQIIQLVKDKKQRELKLDGDIKLTFFPNLGVEFNNLAISEHKGGKEFAAADRFLVSLSILPLLRKQLELDEVRIMGLRANLVRFKDGGTNIDDLLAKDEEPKQFKLDIGHVLAEKTTLAFHDEASGMHFELQDLDLKADMTDGQSGSIENGIRSKVDLSFSLDQSEPAGINLATRVTFGLTLDVGKRHYAVEGLKLKSEGRTPGLNHLMITSTGDLSANLPNSLADQFVADKFTLGITGVSATNNFDIKLDVPHLSLTGENVAGKQIIMMVNVVSSKASNKGKLFLTGLEGTLDNFTSRELTAELESKKGELAVRTMLASPLTGSAITRRVNLPDLKAVIHASAPPMRDQGINATLLGSAALNGLSRNAQASVTGKLADSNMNARLVVTGLAQPGLNFEVDIDQLDLDRFLSLERAPNQQAKIPESKTSDQWLDLSMLENLKVHGSVRIGLLKAANSSASGVKLDIRSD